MTDLGALPAQGPSVPGGDADVTAALAKYATQQGSEHQCEWSLIAESQDAQYVRVTAMVEAAKEAGWAMMEVVDGIAWERRQQFSDIAARLAKSIEAVEVGTPDRLSATHQAAIITDTQGEGEPDETVRDQSPAIDTQDLRDLISDAIGDSMDMDWTYSDGARSIIRAFEREGLIVMQSGASKAAPDGSGYITPLNTSPEPVSEPPENEQVDS